MTFEAPSSVPNAHPASINPAGAITGDVEDTHLVFHSVLRARDGTFTSFDVPDAGTGFFQGTFPEAINPAGAITGIYVDFDQVPHGFLRARDGTITAFDPAGSLDTEPTAINPAGVVTGYYFDATGTHGFLRD